MARRKVANPLALAVLTLLAERPMHPYEMANTLRERHKEDSIKLNYGSLYSVVEALQRHDLITAQETVRDGRRPERTIYALTPAGANEQLDWLGELVAMPVKEFTQFEAALSLIGALPPDDAVALLRQRLVRQRMQVKAYEGIRDATPENFPELFMIESGFRYELLKTETAFIARLIDAIESGTLGGLKLWRRIYELRESELAPAEMDATLQEEFKDELTWINELTRE